MRIAAAAVIAGVALRRRSMCATTRRPNKPRTAGTLNTPYTPSADHRAVLLAGLPRGIRGRPVRSPARSTSATTTGRPATASSRWPRPSSRWIRVHQAYDFAANAATVAEAGVDQSALLRAIAILERGIAEFPTGLAPPLLAGQIYLQDLKTDGSPAATRVGRARRAARGIVRFANPARLRRRRCGRPTFARSSASTSAPPRA